uniref:Uncharacterized protein n=1 Tax=Leptocylindrus danicus TaxID=163516 RepID=A0A7S2PJZ5_9STRA
MRPAEEDGHDGVIMVRLKKKRFIVIDYSLGQYDPPNSVVNASTGASRDQSAGGSSLPSSLAPYRYTQHRSICITHGCHKVGIPNLVYDSEPTEPTSLYLRSGLCFTCQRNVNEKRRTQRKRKSDGMNDPTSSSPKRHSSTAGMQNIPPMYDIGSSLFDASTNGAATGSANTFMPSVMGDPITTSYQQQHMDMNLPSATAYTSTANSASAAAMNMNMNMNQLQSSTTGSTSHTSMLNPTLENARVAIDEARQNMNILLATSSINNDGITALPIIMKAEGGNTGATRVDVAVIYENAMSALQRGMTLLQQWKTSYLDVGASSNTGVNTTITEYRSMR